MNIDQLERLRKEVALMKTILEMDPEGTTCLKDEINNLDLHILERIKDLVWAEYLEAEG